MHVALLNVFIRCLNFNLKLMNVTVTTEMKHRTVVVGIGVHISNNALTS